MFTGEDDTASPYNSQWHVHEIVFYLHGLNLWIRVAMIEVQNTPSQEVRALSPEPGNSEINIQIANPL